MPISQWTSATEVSFCLCVGSLQPAFEDTAPVARDDPRDPINLDHPNNLASRLVL